MKSRFSVLVGYSIGNTPVSSFFSRLCMELTARGHRAKALVWIANPLEARLDPALDFVSWPSPRPTRWVDARFYWKALKTLRPDGVIANFASVNWMTLLGWLQRVPLRVVHYHTLSTQIGYDTRNSKLKSLWLRRRRRLLYRLATHLVGNSLAAAKDASSSYGIPGSKCVVQYFGLEDPLARLAPQPAAGRSLRLVCPGRLDYSKGQDVLVRALPTLIGRFPGLQVHFLGDGPQKEKLMELAARLGVAGACRFVGVVPHEQVLQELSHCMAAVVPSRSESFGLVNIEALSVGTPVVASNVGGIPEIIRAGIDGYLVPPGDPVAMQTRLGEFLTDAELRAQAGRNARERFLSTFEIGERVRHYADWLEVELEGRVGRPHRMPHASAEAGTDQSRPRP
ncbi:MAG: glycosyltransferase family 4 protein [Limisphaerales bacterium]